MIINACTAFFRSQVFRNEIGKHLSVLMANVNVETAAWYLYSANIHNKLIETNFFNFVNDLKEVLSQWNFNTGSTVYNNFLEFIHIFQTITNKILQQENCHDERNNFKQTCG